ncbi:MAG: TRAP transporter small permease [candidate division KSB1 bacterium]|nr:TRAP transporter small permease [candidate division KSB1 bacterium]MDZ7336635.1 TRAP transporter small permease [candidate division KSB1 bacterium]MDZ7359069.1 TRAP transporter small permease [candidate division KSB1 bacterium]MDZ7401121.1 TRAP transporter small permease [candidate division KSB1 bacterium]
MTKITKIISKILGVVLTVLMGAMVIDVTWQVLSRFVIKNPSSYTEELAGFLLIWIGLLGSSYAYYTKAHLGIDVLVYRLSGVKRKIIEISINLIVLTFAFFVMVLGGIRLVKLTFTLGQISPALGIEMGYIYMVIPIAGILMIYFAIQFIINNLKTNSSVPDKF